MKQDQQPTIEHIDGPDQSNRRRSAIGVTAGLLAGGAIGLFAVAPTFSSAATPDDTELQDDAETSERSAPGTHLRDALQALVDDGTIDAGQADAVAAHLAEVRPERGEHARRRGPRPGVDGEVVADIIGIDAESLRDQLRDGSSIATIAEANGVDPQAVIDALVDEAAAHLELAEESGRLTSEEAAEKESMLEERVTARVNGERPTRPATN